MPVAGKHQCDEVKQLHFMNPLQLSTFFSKGLCGKLNLHQMNWAVWQIAVFFFFPLLASVRPVFLDKFKITQIKEATTDFYDFIKMGNGRKSFNNGETDQWMTSTHPRSHAGPVRTGGPLCLTFLPSLHRSSPGRLIKTPLDAVLKMTSVQTQNFCADVFWECYFSTHFPQLSFLESWWQQGASDSRKRMQTSMLSPW